MDRKRKLKTTLGIAMYLHEEHHILGHAFNETMESDCLNILAVVLITISSQVVFSTRHRSCLLDIASTTSVGYLLWARKAVGSLFMVGSLCGRCTRVRVKHRGQS